MNLEEIRNYKRKREINGTPEYMSPELMQFEPPSVKSDIWALGVILYEMATLDLPFRYFLFVFWLILSIEEKI
jgi:serine/threonine protein kinase